MLLLPLFILEENLQEARLVVFKLGKFWQAWTLRNLHFERRHISSHALPNNSSQTLSLLQVPACMQPSPAAISPSLHYRPDKTGKAQLIMKDCLNIMSL